MKKLISKLFTLSALTAFLFVATQDVEAKKKTCKINVVLTNKVGQKITVVKVKSKRHGALLGMNTGVLSLTIANNATATFGGIVKIKTKFSCSHLRNFRIVYKPEKEPITSTAVWKKVKSVMKNGVPTWYLGIRRR